MEFYRRKNMGLVKQFKVGDRVLLKAFWKQALDMPYRGPYIILSIDLTLQ